MNIQKLNKICMGIRMFALLNFDLLIVIAIIIGGDAVSGYVTLNHYILSLGLLKTEVSYSVYMYSLIHFYSFFAVTLPIWVASEISWVYFNFWPRFSTDKKNKKDKPE